MNRFKLVSEYQPCGDQPRAIAELSEGVLRGDRYQTLLGVTGSGKTYTMARVIENVQKPTLVISHNKTLAAQLYGELKGFFPDNAVEYFISYYDYYQPEAYLPTTDLYIEKDASINDDINRLRLRATTSLMERRDTVIVASVSCIYGLGSPQEYRDVLLFLRRGDCWERKEILSRLTDIYYNRNDVAFSRGTFRVRGDVIEVIPAYDEVGIRIELFGDEIERVSRFDLLTGKVIQTLEHVALYPARHFVTPYPKIEQAAKTIEKELEERLSDLQMEGKLLEAQRLETRTRFDLEMMLEIGYCSGIENYSRHLSGRKAGERPYVLLDYFPDDFLVFIDESHVTIPQLRGMYAGDRSRKENLVQYGFRLPSALDNRPLIFEEFEALVKQVVFVSATPSDYELEKSGGVVVEQIIRPTGLVDPEILVRPIEGQIDDLLEEIRRRVERRERVLVTTLTKRMAEDLSEYLNQMEVAVRYIHHQIDSIERVEILRDLRLGEFDVLVGINLLREGLDLPEVSLVAILDADKEGFLRSERSLIQTAGRAARNVNGTVIMYADSITDSMRRAISETNRRRQIQLAYNQAHGITPQTIYKTQEEILRSTSVADARTVVKPVAEPVDLSVYQSDRVEELIAELDQSMREAAAGLEFEKAAQLRDEIARLKEEREQVRK